MKMKAILALLGVIVVANGSPLVENHVCEDESTGIQKCCDGYSGSISEGCPTPVCEETCELYGGTCVAANLCMNCPDDRYGVNCEKSQCQQTVEDHKGLSSAEQRRVLRPSCLSDGSYAILQCHQVTGLCHCADRWTGEAYDSTYTYGVPDCSEYYIEDRRLFSPKVVALIESSEESSEVEPEPEPTGPATPPCTKAHEKWASSSYYQFFYNEPLCEEDGYYVSKRCRFGYCICVDRYTGLDIEATKRHSLDLICDDSVQPEPEPVPEETAVPEDGCVIGDIAYKKNQSFYRDCNLCVCHGHNIIQCTQRDCTTDACHLGELNKIVEHKYKGSCHSCVCNYGVYECNMANCDTLGSPVQMDDIAFCGNKPPTTNYIDECNLCYCTADGVSICTTMGCSSAPSSCHVGNEEFRRNFKNGDSFTRGCDTFRCDNGELETLRTCNETMKDMVLTKEKPETACVYKGETFFNGESMLLGKMMCKCEKFTWDCQPMVMMM